MELPPLSLTTASDLVDAVLVADEDFAILTGLGATRVVAAVRMLRSS